jgi:hypothetical protein
MATIKIPQRMAPTKLGEIEKPMGVWFSNSTNQEFELDIYKTPEGIYIYLREPKLKPR